ncbi:MAG: N-acetyltransferase [Clostridia bacterium]|nr:N-acetyltransferase [Clostridia bacterium]
MNIQNIIIRRETENDYRTVENMVRESFWNVYRPGCTEHYVLRHLRNDPAFVPELDLVMEKDGQIIGQNMFMRAVIRSDDGRDIPIMTMGPICIAPEYKRQGYGKLLLDASLEKAREIGCPALCFEGNILFYGKCGFTYARNYGIRYHDLPEGADDSFFLCQELIPGYLNGITGEYAPPEGYFAAEQNPENFEAYDAQFPPKEKKVLPGQLGQPAAE